MSFRIKYIDKTFTYYLAFTFRLGNTFQFRKKLSTGIHTDYIQTETLIIVHHILELVFTKHTVIHKDTSQILTDRLIQQNSSYRRIHSAAQTQHNLVITQLCLQLGNRTFDERSRRPVLFATANIHYEIFQNLRTVFTVVYLRMELHAPHLFTLNLISSNFHFVGSSCRLLALNLYSYVDKPFTAEASFDFAKFRDHVGKAMRMMDDIIDLELEKVEQIIAKIDADPEEADIRYVESNLWKKVREMALKGRRTGLGITAEGDMIAALGMRYGSDEAVAFAVEVHKTLALAAYGASVEMAEERGAFPLYDAARELDNPMIARIREADPALYERMVKSGRRNIAMLTIAPTGTTSLMSQTTSGIEPVFRPVYKRRRKINPSDHNVKVAFVDDTGERFEEFYVFHHNFVEWARVNGHDTSTLATISDAELEKLVAASPYHKATANDIDWVAKVKMQGAIQKWVDHSISVTVNLPNNVSEALVADVYRTAWECGCKGVTVYRDGCRDGVLLEKNSKKKKRCEEHPGEVQKRPKSIPADIVRFKNGTEDWIAFVGLQDGRPYEVFTGKIEEDAMFIPPKIKKGFIIKVREADGTKRYDFQYTDRYGYTNTIGGISRLFNEEFWNYAKLISGVLRHGMPIEKTVSLIESLHLDSESINTWKTGVCRALKQYIVDGTKSKGKCPSCGQENMAYQNGCLTCMSCGYSKCG